MKNLEYREEDQDALKEALDLYIATYGWWLTATLTTDPERELARKNIASARRIKEAIQP